ncbi:1-aminocyclopropane-1-carboxylate deaminase/D-cysteine desulfhydrase [Leeuwenhoekiella sp. MAR_2009_132]|uniref:1-aminocyclopropane-1-carboxylate deaminase/D-cysteine desulfhydrase n=1 Tax=Leeuwenhoekiella sp. MAR_2009_132 TaxID=1392489 RepID=UPI001F431F21|nr:pyridoxal-phosphate dependent enzyme [Leeuwenhoekiella sp. MAR_2009_132]
MIKPIMANPELLFSSEKQVPIQNIDDHVFRSNNVFVSILREDLLHKEVSGNKFRKLKYNLIEAQEQRKDTLLTYGGAFSNHIAATAKAGQICGFNTMGIIRGEELGIDLNKTLQQNATLKFAHECGMKFYFITRAEYREKDTASFRESLKQKFGDFYEIHEGGTNHLAVKGCSEILNENTAEYDYIMCPVGTGGTIAGLIEGSLSHQKVIGFPALKGDFLNSEIEKLTSKKNWDLNNNYHFEGYGKVNSELIAFINSFKNTHNIQLEPIYTGKMMYGLTDLISNAFFSENTRILAVHTGGLQGISGINYRLKKSGKSTIKV